MLTCFSRLYNKSVDYYQKYCSFTLKENAITKERTLTFVGNNNTHLNLACAEIVDKTKNVSSAVFNLPCEYMIEPYRVNHLNLETIIDTVQNPNCQLKYLKIADESLELVELKELCKKLPVTLTHIEIPMLKVDVSEKHELYDLKQNLKDRKIFYSIVGRGVLLNTYH